MHSISLTAENRFVEFASPIISHLGRYKHLASPFRGRPSRSEKNKIVHFVRSKRHYLALIDYMQVYPTLSSLESHCEGHDVSTSERRDAAQR